MIVLDEQLLGKGLEEAIGKWYPGAVISVLTLRPGTIIKDEAIPTLLRGEAEPTFVTINESDFWLKLPAGEHFCMVCFALPTWQATRIDALLRRLLKHGEFDTKGKRIGKVVRVTLGGDVSFYDGNKAVRSVGMI